MFDPEVPELPALLPESHFPDTRFRHPDVLAALRLIGLKSTLGWPDLVEAAASVETLRDARGEKGQEGESTGSSGDAEAARVRGRALLTYLDTHDVRLFNLKETTGLWQRMAKLVQTDMAAEERSKERLMALHELMVLSWVR